MTVNVSHVDQRNLGDRSLMAGRICTGRMWNARDGNQDGHCRCDKRMVMAHFLSCSEPLLPRDGATPLPPNGEKPYAWRREKKRYAEWLKRLAPFRAASH